MKLHSKISSHPKHRHARRHEHHFMRSGHGVANLLVARDPRAMSISELVALCEDAGLELRGVHDEFLYHAGLLRLQDALITANDSEGAELLLNTTLLQRLQLGEVLNPDGVASHSLFLAPQGAAMGGLPRSLGEGYQMDAVPVPMPLMSTSELAEALQGLTGGAGITCRGQGTNASLALPSLSAAMVRFIDGHRSVGDIFRMARKTLQALDSALFTRQFGLMFHAFHSCNNMYLTYNRQKYKSLYHTVKRTKHSRRPLKGACTTKRCKAKQQREAAAEAEEDYRGKQIALLQMGLYIQNRDGYTKGVNIHA